MAASDFDREELLERKRSGATRDAEAARPQELDWASAVGNTGVQRIARSSAGRKAPVGPGMMPLATGVLARQSDLEEEEKAGGEPGAAVAEAPAPAEAEAPPPAGAEAAAAESASAAQPEGEELEEE